MVAGSIENSLPLYQYHAWRKVHIGVSLYLAAGYTLGGGVFLIRQGLGPGKFHNEGGALALYTEGGNPSLMAFNDPLTYG